MEGNDISFDTKLAQASFFEGVLAHPPMNSPRYLFHKSRNNWESAIPLWKPNDMPMRSLVDCVNRLGIGTDVITFLHEEAVEPIYQWLLRKGVQTTVLWYPSVEDYRDDIKYNMGLKVVYVPEQDDALILGIKAKVVSPNTAWSV